MASITFLVLIIVLPLVATGALSATPASGALRDVQLDYQPGWSTEFVRMHDSRGDVWIFGAFWDVRYRLYSIRNGYWSIVDPKTIPAKVATTSNSTTPAPPTNNANKQGHSKQQKNMQPTLATATATRRRLAQVRGNPLYVRVYMLGRKRLFGIGNFARGSTDYRTGICELHYESGITRHVTYYVQTQSREVDKQKRSLIGVYAICRLPELNAEEKENVFPVAVSLIPLNYTGAKNVIVIRGNRQAVRRMLAVNNNNFRKPDKRRDLAICVRPLFGQFTNYHKLANFLMYYSEVGVSHIVLYNGGAATPRLIQLVKTAQSSEFSVEIRPWSFDDPAAYEQMQNMNIEVCVNSLLGLFKFVAIVDFDELIVPRHRDQIVHMLDDQNKRPQSWPPIYAFLFKSAFFCKSVNLDTNNNSLQANPSMIILREARRSEIIHDARYKYIVRPEALYEAQIHMPLLSPLIMWKYGENASLYVSSDEALLHHYRGSEGLESNVDEANNCTIIDEILPNAFGKRILEGKLYKKFLLGGFLEPLEKQNQVITSPPIAYNLSASGSAQILIPYVPSVPNS